MWVRFLTVAAGPAHDVVDKLDAEFDRLPLEKIDKLRVFNVIRGKKCIGSQIMGAIEWKYLITPHEGGLEIDLGEIPRGSKSHWDGGDRAIADRAG